MICFLTFGELRWTGSVGKFVLSLSSWLSSRSMDNVVVCMKPISLGIFPSIYSINEKQDSVKVYKRTRAVPGFIKLIFMIGLVAVTVLYLLQLNKRKRFSLIYAQDKDYAGLTGIIAGKFLRIPVIVHSHGPILYLLPKNFRVRFSRLELNLRKFINRIVVRFSNAIVCVDKLSRDHILLIGANKSNVAVIPMAVETHRVEDIDEMEVSNIHRELNIGAKSFIIGYVGRLVKEKNVDVLIRAFKEVKNVNENAKLLIVGDGPEMMRLCDLTKKFEIDNSVIFTGVREDIPQLLSVIDIFVLPSSFEGSPMALIEAMSSGKAIVASEIPAIKEIIKEGEAILVPPKDVGRLAEALNVLLSHKNLRMELEIRVREKALSYDYDYTYTSILKLCKELKVR